MRRVHVTIVRVEKTKIMTYFECVFVASVIHHAKNFCHFILSVASLVPRYFSTLSHKRHDFRKTFESKILSDSLYNFRLNIYHSKKNSAN